MRATRLVLAGGLMLAPVVPAYGQHLGGAADPEISLVRILAALVLCIGAAIALALLISKRGGTGRFGQLAAKLQRPSRLAVIEARRISPHADLCLVRCDGKEYLLVCGTGEIRVLAESGANSGELSAEGGE